MDNPFICALDAKIDPRARTVEITLTDGEVYRCSLAEVSERLRLVDPELVARWEWIGPKAGIHWPAADEDLSIEYLVAQGTRCKPASRMMSGPESLSQTE